MKAASKRNKGYRLEARLVKLFERWPGWTARRQPGSGKFSGFPHDLRLHHPSVGELIVEAKKWKHGWRTGDNAMGQADMLVIERDYGEPCVYLKLTTFSEIVAALDERAEAARKIA